MNVSLIAIQLKPTVGVRTFIRIYISTIAGGAAIHIRHHLIEVFSAYSTIQMFVLGIKDEVVFIEVRIEFSTVPAYLFVFILCLKHSESS